MKKQFKPNSRFKNLDTHQLWGILTHLLNDANEVSREIRLRDRDLKKRGGR